MSIQKIGKIFAEHKARVLQVSNTRYTLYVTFLASKKRIHAIATALEKLNSSRFEFIEIAEEGTKGAWTALWRKGAP